MYKGEWNAKRGGQQLRTCYKGRAMPSLDTRRAALFIKAEPTEVIWSYDVVWKESEIEWASRWDVYLSMAGRYNDDVHWWSIISSSVVVLFLSGLIALILTATLRKDIARYNQVLSEEERELLEETGWKLVSHDVFRPPEQGMLFCAVNGSGIQLLFMATLTILFAAFGYLNPSRRGSIIMGLVFLFIAMGVPAGYASLRLYKFFKLKDWKRCTVWTALGLPGCAFAIFFCVNLLVWAHGSARAVPFGSIMVIMVLWLCVSAPLVFGGAVVGMKQPLIDVPIGANQIARMVPEQSWHHTLPVLMLFGGALPFAAVYVELYFIFSSLWLNQYYYVFGFLLMIFLILIATCAEVGAAPEGKRCRRPHTLPLPHPRCPDSMQR
jgi:transmembrane 9 superfamily protein 2/4